MKKIISMICLIVLCFNGGIFNVYSVQAASESNLIARWQFEDNLNDSIGIYNGTAQGTLSYNPIDMNEGDYSLELNGSSQANMGNVPVSGKFSIAFWVKPDKITADWKNMVAKHDTENQRTFWIGQHADAGKLRFGLYLNGNTEAALDTDTAVLSNDTWNHVVCTYDGNYQKIYIDGILVKTSSDRNASLASYSSNFVIGSDNEYGLYYDGMMDDVRVYNTALSLADINTVYSSTTRNMTAQWNFENNYNDSYGNYNGTATGSPVFLSSSTERIIGDYSLDLDGVDDTINCGNVPVSGEFTVGFWVKPHDIAADWKNMVAKQDTENQRTFWIGQHGEDGKLRFGLFLDGNDESRLDTDTAVLSNDAWSHVACTYDGHYQKIFINGELVKTSSDLNTPLTNYSSNFSIGSNNENGFYYDGIIDDVRLYKTALSDNNIQLLYNTGVDFSAFTTQVGYHNEDTKYYIIRHASANPNIDPIGKTFKVINTNTGESDYTGTISYWGEKWESHWWIGDFSELKTDGTYYIEAFGNTTNDFKIGDTIVMDEGIVDTMLDNLDDRVRTTANYMLSPDIKIWTDCGGSNMCEVQSATITMNALIDLLDYQESNLTSTQITRIKDHIKLGAQYFIDIQQTTSNPNTNGRIHHMGIGWNESELYYFAWRDMASVIPTLVRAYRVINPSEPSIAGDYLSAAQKAYTCASYRPYNLTTDFSSSLDGFPDQSGTTNSEARRFYHIEDSSWNLPSHPEDSDVGIEDLRARDILPFIWGCTELYDVTNDNQYLNKAKDFANAVVERQFVDYDNPIEGTYGYLYEFKDNQDVFTTESHQAARWHMGNYDPLRMKGIIDLIRYMPDDEDTADWYNLIKIYGENYLKKHTDLSPLGITPLTIYEHCGIKFYQNLNHGANCIYGLAGVNMLEIGDLLEDKTYQDLGARNINYITGFNPGFPNAYAPTQWEGFSFAAGLGANSFGGTTNHPKGSVPNGFEAGAQFSVDAIDANPDAPNGIYKSDGSLYFNEDGIPHTFSFLNGVTMLENKYTITINTKNAGSSVDSNVGVVLEGISYSYSTGGDGSITITDLPVGKSGNIAVTYNGNTISKNIASIASSNDTWDVDFDNYVDVSVTVPDSLNSSEQGTCTVTVYNRGTSNTTANVKLSSAGVTLNTTTLAIPVNAGQSASQNVTITGGNKNMPYMVYTYTTSGTNKVVATASGKVKVVPIINDYTSRWALDNNFDDSEQNYTGTASGSPVFSDSDKKEGSYAVQLDGTDDKINCGNVSLAGEFSIAFWAKPNNTAANWKNMVAKHDTENQRTFWIGQHSGDGKLRFGIYLNGNDETALDTDSAVLSDTTWSHVVCTYNGQYQKIYVDGNLVKTGSNLDTTLPSYSSNFIIGSDNEYGLYYDGMIDDVRVYNRTLTDTEVSTLHSSY